MLALLASATAVCCAFAFTACKDADEEEGSEISYGETIKESDFYYREIKKGSKTIAYAVSGADGKEYTEVTIPSSYNGKPVTEIYRYAFSDCDDLTSVTIPDGVTTIGNSAFDCCSKLATVNLPNTVNLIGEEAFAVCESLNEIEIPSSVTVIERAAFRYCELTSINLPEGVKEIGEEAFYGCLIETCSLNIPASLTSIGKAAFGCCAEDFESITVAEGNTVYKATDNCLIETASGLLVTGSKAGTIPQDGSIKEIGAYAFAHLHELEEIEIPDGVTTIGQCAFYDCGLKEFKVPESVTYLGDSAFYNNKFTTVVIPEHLTHFGSAFKGCRELTKLVIPEGITKITDNALTGCHGLRVLVIPKTVTQVGGSVLYETYYFYGEVYYTGTPAEWAAIEVESGNDTLKSMPLHYYSATQPAPEAEGSFWHYVDGVETLWE